MQDDNCAVLRARMGNRRIKLVHSSYVRKAEARESPGGIQEFDRHTLVTRELEFPSNDALPLSV